MDPHEKENEIPKDNIFPSACELFGLVLSFIVLLCTANFSATDVAFYATTLVMAFQCTTATMGLLSTDIEGWKTICLFSFLFGMISDGVALWYVLKQPALLSTTVGHIVVFILLLAAYFRNIAGDVATIMK